MSRKIINQIIRNVVQQNSIPDGTIPSPDAQFSLNRYFDDPNSVDLVYENMIDRVKNEKTHYDQVLSRILKLIKNNIGIHPPSYPLLLDLDSFCLEIAPGLSIALQKTVTYIRALISNQVKQIHQQQQQHLHQTLRHSNSNANGGSGIKSLAGSAEQHQVLSGSGDSNSSTNSQKQQEHAHRKSLTVIGMRSRSHSASTNNQSYHHHKDEFLLQRSSLDLTNVLSTSNPSTSILSTSSSSSSSSSSPLSINESPLKNSLNTPLSPNLSSHGSSNPGSFNMTLNGSASGINAHNPMVVASFDSSNNTPSTILSSSSGLNGSNGSYIQANALMNSSSSIYKQDLDGFIRDLMLMKTNMVSTSNKSLNGLSVFESLLTAAEIKEKDIFKCPNDNNNWDSINIVREAKKKNEKKDFNTIYTLRKRKLAPLFQYKYYSDQEPLKITEAEIAQVIRVIQSPATPQDRSIATKMFIKIVMDQYCKANDSNELCQMEKVILDYFKQLMFSTPAYTSSNHQTTTRIHTLNILFNLSIHMNIYTELKLENTQDNEHNRAIISELQDSLFNIFITLLNSTELYHQEKEEKFWMELLHCLLFFITDQGNVVKDKLLRLNSQLIPSLLANLQETSDYMKRILVRMLCNQLYRPTQQSQTVTTPSLNEEELASIGGIEFIIKLYTSIRSYEAKTNLFVIIYDYSLIVALKSQAIIETQVVQESPILLELFRKADIPHYFTQIFKCLPINFVSNFFLCNTADNKNDTSFSYEDLIIKLAWRLNDCAIEYQKVDQSRYQRLSELDFIDPSNQQQQTEKINSIVLELLGNDEDDQALFNVENWFFNILKNKDREKELIAAYAHSIYVQLASSPSPKLRRIYISLTERLLLNAKYKFKAPLGSDTKLPSDIIDLFNENISKLIHNEKSESNLLYIIDILFDLIYSRTNHSHLSQQQQQSQLIFNSNSFNPKKYYQPQLQFNFKTFKQQHQQQQNATLNGSSNLIQSNNISSNNSNSNSNSSISTSNILNDTNFSLFLTNQFVVSISLLKLISIQIIQYLFNSLSHSERTNDQRLFLLHLLIQRCKNQEDLLKVGGIGFFKSLLSDQSTQVAYHSSYFLLTQLESESPEQYRTILTRLLSKAKENNNENLISNPFFQVQGIIEMTLDKNHHQS